LGGALTVYKYSKMVRGLWLMMGCNQMHTANMISQGRAEELRKAIEERLPGDVKGIELIFGKDESKLYYLQLVKKYYEKNKIPVPKEIAGILSKVPPLPPASCEIKHNRESDANSPSVGVK
jgi:hypothetical protein